MKSLKQTKLEAINRRAKKVGADPAVVAKFIELLGDRYPSLSRGNSKSWRRYGRVCGFGQPITVVDGVSIITDHELTVRTTWKGADYTVTTKLTKVVFGKERTEEILASASREVLWKGHQGTVSA